MKIDREQWARLSSLLDDALDIEASAREAWIKQLPNEVSSLKEPLRSLLAQHARVETDDFLKTPDFAAALRLESARSQIPTVELQADVQLGGYRLLRELGRGGMGSVWLAERIDGKLKRQVALKFPYAGPNQRQLAERLARERDILASLEHPNIARLYDADVTDNGQPFLVLEYVDGIPINDYCDQQRLKVRERLVLFLQVLNAIQYAHTRLVIHRDLKPSNILITKDGIARLLDFGIAKLVSDDDAQDSALTQFGGRALTPDYASPEQISGHPITTASDLYSLGVVMYELLTGGRPYRLKRDSRASLEDAIAAADVIAPSRSAIEAGVAAARATTPKLFVKQLRGDLDTIVMKMLRKEAAERYPSVDALMRDIERSLDNEPVEAQPYSRLYVFKKLIIRNRAAFGAIGVVVVTLMIGIGVSLWQAARAKASEQRAVAAAETSEAVKQFMIRIFQTNSLNQEDPAKAREKNALQLLEAGANRVGEEFKDDPRLQREMLAVILRLLGESRSEDYEKHALRYIELSKGFPGTEVEQAGIYVELSVSEQGKKAEEYAQTGLKVLGTLSDAPARKQRGTLLWAYAHALQYGGNAEGSVASLVEARELLNDGFSKTAEYGHVLSDLAWVEMRRDNVLGAIEYFKQALQAIESDPTSYQRSIALGRYDLAMGYLGIKRFADAERELRVASAIFEKSYGANDSQTAFNNARLAQVVAAQNRYEEAVGLLQAAIRVLENPTVKVNSNADYLLFANQILAETLLQSGNLRDAGLHIERLLKNVATRAPVSQISPFLLSADHQSMLGNYAAAEKAVRHGVALAVNVYGAQSSQVAKFNNRLGRILIEIGKLDEADALFTVNRKDNLPQTPFNSAPTAAAIQHAKVLLTRNKGAEAAVALQAEMKKFMAQPVEQRDLSDEVELQLLLGRALMMAGRAADGLPHFERALQLRLTQSPTSPRLAEAQVALAECKWTLGDIPASRALLAKARVIHAANPQLGARYRKPFTELNARLAAAK